MDCHNWCLEFASVALKDNRGIIMAVGQDGRALQYASPELQVPMRGAFGPAAVRPYGVPDRGRSVQRSA